jgi:hypothetical protein
MQSRHYLYIFFSQPHQYALDFFLVEMILVVSDGDAIGISGCLDRSKRRSNTVGIITKGNFNLREGRKEY